MRSSAASSLLSTPNAEEEEEDLLESYDATYNRQNSYEDTYDSGNYYPSPFVAKGFKQAQHLAAANGLGVRPRAISVGNLDDPNRSSQRYLSSVETQQDPYANELNSQSIGLGVSANIGLGGAPTLNTYVRGD